MTCVPTAIPDAPPRAGKARELCLSLRDLHGLLGPEAARSRVSAVLDRISHAARQLLQEHAGMSEDLLCVYEQLGIVFEVARRLPGIERESEVLDLFVSSLSRSFSDATVARYQRAVDGTWRDETGRVPDDWVGPCLDRQVEAGRVGVEEREAFSADPARIVVGPVFAGEGPVCVIVIARTSSAPEFRASDVLLLDALTTFCGDVIRNHRLVRELGKMSLAMVQALVNTVDQKDVYTSGHSVRVSFWATELGRRVGLDAEAMRQLHWSALLHDVGKIGIRDDVLKKAGKLEDHEFEHIKEHPQRGYKILAGVPQLVGALDGVLHHHERYDGKGYPHGLKGEQIPLQARFIQIADIFDALTSTRAYRGAFPWHEALAILERDAGSAVDPGLCATFCDWIRSEATDEDAWRRLLNRANAFGAAPDRAFGPAWKE